MQIRIARHALLRDYSLECTASASAGILHIRVHMQQNLKSFKLKEELVDLGFPTSELAKRIRSANTLIKVGESWKVDSTDVVGFQQSVAAKTNATFQNILILLHNFFYSSSDLHLGLDQSLIHI